MSSSLRYLHHIDGLRAFAVLIVIFFHFGVVGFGAGFIGVDIFFVISGFLITRLIAHEFDSTGKFSFANFYLRRVRRLMPALFFVFALTTFAAVFILTPESLAGFGASLVSATFSLSNVFFWFESGYFDTSSNVKPLLHTWSLSVEEQFYLFWPAMLLLVLKKTTPSKRFFLILAIGMISFISTAYVVNRASPGFESTIFYWAPFRVFEFAIGAAGVFILQLKIQRWLQEIMVIIALLLIGYSMNSLSEKSVFPYFNALPTCLATLLLILSCDSYLVKILLKNKLAISIGLLSYSLYLVHWPVFVFCHYLFLNVTSLGWTLVMLLVTFSIAFLCYRFIEKPWRGARPGSSYFLGAMVTSALVLCLAGGSMKWYQGWEWRYSPSTALEGAKAAAESIDGGAGVFIRVQDIEAGKAARFKDTNQACNILTMNDQSRCDMSKPIQLLVFGNSHEPDAYNMFNALYQNHPLVNLIVFGTVNDCDLTISGENITSVTQAHECQHRFATLNDKQFIGRLTHIVYNTHYGFDYVAKDLWRILAISLEKNPEIKLIALGSYLETRVDCATLINKSGKFDSCKDKDVVTYFYPDERVISQIPEVKSLPYLYISKYELLCKAGELSTCTVSANGEPMFYDQHHLSYGFARHVGQLIWDQYQRELHALGMPDPLVAN